MKKGSQYKNPQEKKGILYCSISFCPVFIMILVCAFLLDDIRPGAFIISLIVMVVCQVLFLEGVKLMTRGLELEVSRLSKYEVDCVEETVYIDMDEVVYNLSELVIDQYNKDFKKAFDYNDNTKWMWQDTDASEEYFKEVLQSPGIFMDGKPVEFSITVIEQLREAGYKIIFLTQPQWNGACIVEKLTWLKYYFNWFDEEENIIFTSNKQAISGGPNKYIIDDNPNHFGAGWVESKNAFLFKRPWNDGGHTWLQIGSKLIAKRGRDS